ncbi:unnamed protein product, partial [Allacma fusca]
MEESQRRKYRRHVARDTSAELSLLQNLRNQEPILKTIRTVLLHSEEAPRLLESEIATPSNANEINSDQINCFQSNWDKYSSEPNSSGNTANDSDESESDGNDHSESEDHDSDEETISFMVQLAKLCVDHQLTHTCVNAILKLVKKHQCFHEFPKDARTLLKTPRQSGTEMMEPGEYIHFGITRHLNREFCKPDNDTHVVILQVSTDGIPITRSTNAQFWPIMGCAINLSRKPFVIGVYCGTNKPKNNQTFLQKTLDELKDLLLNSFMVNNNVRVEVFLHSFIADAPARAFITATKGHSGYFSCLKCKIEGEYYKNRVIFVTINCPVRTNEMFRLKTQEEHHI